MRENDLMKAVNYGGHELVVSYDVYRRDGWVCQLCFEPVDKKLTYPHPRSASLDHITPRGFGGRHTYDNNQLAHLFCNQSEGAKIRGYANGNAAPGTHPAEDA